MEKLTIYFMEYDWLIGPVLLALAIFFGYYVIVMKENFLRDAEFSEVTRENYDNKKLPKLYFKEDYCRTKSRILYHKGTEFKAYEYSYVYLQELIVRGVLTTKN